MSNETIFSEVDEELRRERMRKLWRQFGPYIIGAAVAVVIAVALNEGWQWWQNSNAARSSDQFYAALELAEAGDVAGAQTALDGVVASGSGNYPLLAQFRKAALLGRDGKTAEAVAAYDALANTASQPRLRELALILSANLLVDSGDLAGVQQRVQGLAVPENPMRNAALEAIGLTQYKAGDINGALSTFETIAADATTSSEVRQRVQIYIAQLVAEGATTADPAADAAAAAEPVPADPTADAAAAAEPVPADPTASPMMEAPPMMDAPAEAAPAAPAETTTTNGG
jgi:hypothetical protein